MKTIHFVVRIGLGVVFCLNILAIAQDSHAQDSEGLNIVATHTILADIVGNVAGDTGYVVSLMTPGDDPHSFNLSARDIVTLEDADIVFINGAGFEETLLDVIYETSSDKVVVASDCVNILPIADIGLADNHQHEENSGENHVDEIDADVHDEHCHLHYETLETMTSISEHSEDTLGHLYEADCAEGNCDPHVWLDVQNVMLWTLQIRDALIELDPTNEQIYQENAAQYLTQLVELDTEMSNAFLQIPHEDRILVTNHDVLSYLAYRYDFDIVGTVVPTASTSAEPSTSDVISVITTIQDTGATAIFVDNTANSVVAEQIADETGIRVQILYTGSLSVADEPAATYLDYMRYNTQQIVDGLNH